MSTELTTTTNATEISIISQDTLMQIEAAAQMGIQGTREPNAFARAAMIAESFGRLRKLLSGEVAQKFMALQGSALGFKTDKVYNQEIVVDAIIEATLRGVYPVGNEFNIIAGRCYITKEGFGHLLRDIKGLQYMITPGFPQMISDKEAKIDMEIHWKYNGNENEKTIGFSIRVNSGMGADAIIGKATRKARAWLHAQVTGMEISDGDAEDASIVDVKDSNVIDVKNKPEKPTLAGSIPTKKSKVEKSKTESEIFHEMEERIYDSRSIDELKTIWNELEEIRNAGKIGEQHFNTLRSFFTDMKNKLNQEKE